MIARGLAFLGVIASFNVALSQPSPIELGKRVLYGRAIKATNVGRPQAAFSRVFFAIDSEPYQKAGRFGKNLVPYFQMDSQSWESFLKFQSRKQWSRGLLLITAASFAAWHLNIQHVYLRSNSVNKALFGPSTLALVIACEGSYHLSYVLSLRADRHLGMAAFHYNRNVAGSFSQ